MNPSFTLGWFVANFPINNIKWERSIYSLTHGIQDGYSNLFVNKLQTPHLDRLKYAVATLDNA
jgi:hypothetical protein